ncbi:MAG: hypothetical protein RLZZ136_23 [Pseudomonadota bacterium]
MGPINWLAVIMSAGLATIIGRLWYGSLSGGAKRAPLSQTIATLALQCAPALMLGHMYARIGPDKLALKPWLYWMQSGGLVLAFIAPALFISYARHGLGKRPALIDAGFWLVVYLATSTLFWALA